MWRRAVLIGPAGVHRCGLCVMACWKCRQGRGGPHPPHSVSWRGGGDLRDNEWGDGEHAGEEAPLAVCVLALALVHLPAAVVTAATHADAEADQGHEQHEERAQRRAHHEAHLVVDGLRNHTGTGWAGAGSFRVRGMRRAGLGGTSTEHRQLQENLCCTSPGSENMSEMRTWKLGVSGTNALAKLILQKGIIYRLNLVM